MGGVRSRLEIYSWTLLLLFLANLVLTAHGGIMVTRPGRSDTECARKCREEADVDCKFYKWNRRKATCFLAADKDTSMTGMKAIDKPKRPQNKAASSWISQLQARLLALEQREQDTKKMREEIAELRAELVALKNSRAMTHHLLRTTKEEEDKTVEALNDKVELLKSESNRAQDAILSLGELQKTLSNKFADMNEARRSTVLSLAMLGQTSKGMRGSIQQLTQLSSETRAGVEDVKKRMTQLEVQFAGLSSDVMEKVASIDSLIGPDVKRTKEAQMSLAQALSMLTKKIIRLVPRIPLLQHAVNNNEGKIAVVWKKNKEVADKISDAVERLNSVESAIRKVTDPSTKENQERSHDLTNLKSQVGTLYQSQRRLQNDVLLEISDRTRLYKELAQTKSDGRQITRNLAAIQTRVNTLRSSVRDVILKGPNSDLVTKLLIRQVQILKNFQLMRQNMRKSRGTLLRFKGEIVTTQSQLAQQGMQFPRYEKKVKAMRLRLYQLANSLRKAMEEPDLRVDTVLKGQNAMLQRMDQLDSAQRKLQRNMLAYGSRLLGFKSITVMERKRHQKEIDQLRMLRSTTNNLYDLMRGIMTNSLYSKSDLSRLKKTLKQHRKVWGYINDDGWYPNLSKKDMKKLKKMANTRRLSDHLDNVQDAMDGYPMSGYPMGGYPYDYGVYPPNLSKKDMKKLKKMAKTRRLSDHLDNVEASMGGYPPDYGLYPNVSKKDMKEMKKMAKTRRLSDHLDAVHTAMGGFANTALLPP